MLKRNLLLCLMCCFCLTRLAGQGVVFMETPEWKEAVKAAKEQKKLLFVDCYTVWCGPCQGLIRNIFPQKEVGDYYNRHFVNVKYDMEKPNGVAFRKLYPDVVEAYPTLLFIDPHTGKIVHKFIGMRKAPEIIAEGKKCFSGGGATELQKRFENGERDFPFMKEYIRSLESSVRDRNEVVAVIERYLAEYDTLPNLRQPEKWEFYSHYLWNVKAAYVQYIIWNHMQIERLKFVDAEKLSKDLQNCLSLAVTRLTALRPQETTGKIEPVEDPELYKLLQKNIQHLSKLPGREEICFKLCVFGQLMRKEWQQAYITANAACDFQFRSADSYRSQVYDYIVQESEDRVLLQQILDDLKDMQEKGAKKFRFHNYCGRIAAVASKLGLQEEAAAARKKFEEISAEREKVHGKQ